MQQPRRTGRPQRPRENNGPLWLVMLAVLVFAAALFVLVSPQGAGLRDALTGRQIANEAATPRAAVGPYTIVVDAGHGGFDAGTQGPETGILEKDLNLSIALLLQKELESRGHTVIMTRRDGEAVGASKEADLQQREAVIAGTPADALISIHQNWYEGAASGPQVFYYPSSERGRAMAESLQSVLNQKLNIKEPRTVNAGNYRLLKAGAAPAVIVECGFLSDPTEERLLVQEAYQRRIVSAIADGLEAYLS